jgi:hypothetical protein
MANTRDDSRFQDRIARNPLILAALPVMRLLGNAPNVLVFTSGKLKATIAAAGFDLVEVAHHASKGKDTRPFTVARRL